MLRRRVGDCPSLSEGESDPEVGTHVFASMNPSASVSFRGTPV
jgi:hypothetical protein